MADKFFHEFPTTTTLKDSSILLIDQDNQTTAVNLGQFKNFLGFPTGVILMFATSGVPTGWLECNGAVLPISDYTNLYNVIGQNYKTLDTFNIINSFQIPDLRGLFVRGWDNGKGIDKDRVLGKTQEDMVGPHTHPYLVPIANGTASRFSTGRDNITNTTNNTENNNGTETRPKNIALVYCIKT